MKRFVKHLLPLGTALAVTVMPIPAAAADQTAAKLYEGIKCNTKYTFQSQVGLNSLIYKWTQTDCQEWVNELLNNCWKPVGPQLPSQPDQGDGSESENPDIEKPEQPNEPDEELPDADAPQQPDIPDVEQPDIDVPDQPDVDVPDQPDTPQLPQEPDTDNDQTGDATLSGYAQQVVDLVNKERAAVGLPALKVNTKLSQVAELKAQDLRDNNYFSHTSPVYGSPFDMMKQFGISYQSAGENIAKGQKTPQSVMNGWMNSQGHRDNILSSKYTEIGVGYVTDSKGNTYWVQMFIRP